MIISVRSTTYNYSNKSQIYKIMCEPFKPHADTNILVDSGASVTILNSRHFLLK